MSKFIRNIACPVGLCLLLVSCGNGDGNQKLDVTTNDYVISDTKETENTEKTEDGDGQDTTISSEDTDNTETSENKDEVVESSTNEKNEQKSSTENSEQEEEDLKSKAEYLKEMESIEEDLKNRLSEMYSGSTQEMIKAANTEYTEWDVMLNSIYSDLRNRLENEEFESLKEEQLNWIEIRDAKSEEAANEFKDGSMEPLAKASSLAESTKERCYELINEYVD